ncbi:MAG: GxxExxY protein [Bacteroidota bacterium]
MNEPSKGLDFFAHEVIGAAIEVHRLLGRGFLESVYEEALSIEMNLRDIPFTRQVEVGVDYKSHIVGRGKLDFLVGGNLIVELKAVAILAPMHSAQLLSYLKTTGFHLGLLINFNTTVLKNGLKRIILS